MVLIKRENVRLRDGRECWLTLSFKNLDKRPGFPGVLIGQWEKHPTSGVTEVLPRTLISRLSFRRHITPFMTKCWLAERGHFSLILVIYFHYSHVVNVFLKGLVSLLWRCTKINFHYADSCVSHFIDNSVRLKKDNFVLYYKQVNVSRAGSRGRVQGVLLLQFLKHECTLKS